MKKNVRSAFTLVELLTVIAIVGILVGLTLPAVQMARESARLASCKNNVRQIGVAIFNFESSNRRLPTNGWGYRWIGDPNVRSKYGQPGSWVYVISPFVDAKSIQELGKGADVVRVQAGLSKMIETPIPVFNCPSRRNSVSYPATDTFSVANLTSVPQVVAKSDFAINAGDTPTSSGPGPLSSSRADLLAYSWPSLKNVTGVSFLNMKVRLKDIKDGQSSTYLIGEKFVPMDSYESKSYLGDDHSMFGGDDADNRRWTEGQPKSDRDGGTDKLAFGSAHPGGCNFAFADGSVHTISFDIDAEIHRNLGNRKDGNKIEEF